MDADILLGQLEELAERIGIQLRYEIMDDGSVSSRGGLCRLRKRYVLIVNKGISRDDKIRTLGQALGHFDLQNIYVRPGLRQFLSKFQNQQVLSEK